MCSVFRLKLKFFKYVIYSVLVQVPAVRDAGRGRGRGRCGPVHPQDLQGAQASQTGLRGAQ